MTSIKTTKYSDIYLENEIEVVKNIIQNTIEKHELWDESCCTFWSYDEYYDDEPSENPCILVLSFDGSVSMAMNGYLDINLCDEINQALENTEFLFELDSHNDGGVYVIDFDNELIIFEDQKILFLQLYCRSFVIRYHQFCF